MSGDHTDVDPLPNGPAAAAILATGIGCATLGLLAFAADAFQVVGSMLNIYNPTGTLSGVTTGAILVWVVAWLVLNRLWHATTVKLAAVNVAAFVFLAIGLLLTCPPIMDLLQGK